MAKRLEAAHGPFTLVRRLMRILRPIVEPFVPAMLNTRYYLLRRCLVAVELVRNQHAWHILAAFEQLAEELLGGSLHPYGVPAPALHKDIEHGAVLINGAPQVVGFAVDFQEHFI